MIQFFHPSLNTPPHLYLQQFSLYRTPFHFSSPNSPYERSANTGPVIYTPVCMPSIPYPLGSNPLLQRVWLMENRLLGGVQICCYCGQDRNNNGKRAAVAYCSYNTTPSPTPSPIASEGVTQKELSLMRWLQAQKSTNK